MSARPPAPTTAELQVLRVLWTRGPSTVRDIHEALYRGNGTGYTTTLKLVQNLHSKGLVDRDDRRRQHVYRALAEENDTLKGMVRTLIERTFAGSGAALAMHALAAKPASAGELAELKALIRRLERERD